MDVFVEFFNDTAFIFVFIAGAAGGLFGGLLAGRKSSGPTSVIVGSVFGLIAALIVFGTNGPTLVPAAGFPLDWAFGVGGFAAFVIGRAN